MKDIIDNCNTVEGVREAAQASMERVARSQATRRIATTKSMQEIIDEIYNSVPLAPLPTKIAFGDLSLGLNTPGSNFDCIYDPLRAMLNDPYVTEYIVDNDTESSGSITSSLIPSAGYAYKVRAIRIKYDTDPDQSGADDALETITFNPEYMNTELVAASQATGTSEVTLGDVTATNTFRYTLPAMLKGGVYVFFAARESSLSKCVPDRAMISQDIASPGELVAGDKTIAPVTTLLVSGSLVRKSSSVLSPASPHFEEFASYMLENYYRRRR